MIQLFHGDSRDVLKSLAADSIDSCVTDPPYALASVVKRFGAPGAAPAKVGQTGAFARASAGFMGQKWDTGETAFDPAFWSEVLRVMKPGAYLAAFGGTRTYHRLATAIELAGFDVRDMIAWLYGTGFPKSHDLGGGRGTAIKPAHEPIVLAQKPFRGTVIGNVERYGTGGLNVDACRIGVSKDVPASVGTARRRAGWGMQVPSADSDGFDPNVGRFPANVCHDGSEEVVGLFPRAKGAVSNGRKGVAGLYDDGLRPAAQLPGYADDGSAARFFYCAKASRSERVSKCSACGDHYLGARRCDCLGADGKPAAQTGHPTVKPVALKRWVARLVTPPGGLVLDPFAGTGTTAAACIEEGLSAILVEREAEYFADIQVRLFGGPEA